LFAIGLSLGFASCADKPQGPTNLDVRQALNAHQFDEARAGLAHIFTSGAADHETLAIKLELMLEVGDGYAAMGVIDALPDAFLDQQARRIARAHALILQGKPQMAVDLYQDVDSSDFSEQDFRMALWAIRELGEDEAFEMGMDEALEAFPASADLNTLAAQQLIGLDLVEQAASFVETALASEPDHYDALLVQGRLALFEYDIPAALESYRAAEKAYPTRAFPVANIGGLLLDLGMLEEADKVLRDGVQAHPDDPFMQWQFARVALAQGNLDLARPALEAARRTYRGTDEFTLFSAQAEERFGNRKLALAEYRRYLRAVGEDEGVERKIAELEAAT